MENADDWKQKYFQSLEKLEQFEHKTRSWEELENLLRLAMNRVAVAAQGVDPVLDKHLDSLRNAVRRGDYPDLEPILENISATVKRLDEQRQRDGGAGNTPPQLLMHLLEQLQFPKAYKKRLKTLQKTLKSLDEHDPVDEQLRDIAALVNELLQSQLPDESAKGLFARFFGAQDASSGPESAAAKRADTDVAETESPTFTDEISGERHSQPTATDSAPRRYQSIPWGDGEQKVIGNFCLRLLEALNFPEALQERVQTLRDTLAAGFELTETGGIIQKIADLITATRVQVEKEKRELQDFLQHLTEHLQDIDRQLGGAEHSRQASLQHNRLLNSAVREQVNFIESSVNEASELTQLKSTIQQHLLTIRRHFEEHRLLEEQQQQELEQALAHSNSRLQALEQESQQLRERLSREHQQAIHDSLTGVFNRLAYEERMEQEYVRWSRYQQPLVVLIFDIDHFKKINDTYGHKAGDKALKLIARTLQKNLRESDFLARFGGEEFIVLMPQTDLPAALVAANKLREAVKASQFHYQQQQVQITVSCGAAQFQGEDSIDSAFQRADQALYKAKQTGRNRCEGH